MPLTLLLVSIQSHTQLTQILYKTKVIILVSELYVFHRAELAYAFCGSAGLVAVIKHFPTKLKGND